MKQAEDEFTKELPVTRRGRKPIGDKPMTPAERKARSRALALGGVVGHIVEAQAAVVALRARLIGRMTPEVAEALVDVELQLELARGCVPNS